MRHLNVAQEAVRPAGPEPRRDRDYSGPENNEINRQWRKSGQFKERMGEGTNWEGGILAAAGPGGRVTRSSELEQLERWNLKVHSLSLLQLWLYLPGQASGLSTDTFPPSPPAPLPTLKIQLREPLLLGETSPSPSMHSAVQQPGSESQFCYLRAV